MKLSTILPALFMLFFLPGYTGAQSFQPVAINYTVDHGVPSSECYSVIQDRKGIIWIGTDKGICKYDGVRFSKLTATDGLPDNVVFGLQEDHKGRIWCRTLSKGVFYIENGKIIVPVFNKALLASVQNNIINNFGITTDDSVFLDVNNGLFIRAKVNVGIVHTQSTSEWTIWIAENKSFSCHNKLNYTKQHIHIFNGKEHFVSPDKISIEEFLLRSTVLKNKDFLFNKNDRLCLKREGSNRIEVINAFKSRIIAIYQDRDSGIWVGTLNNGLYFYDKDLSETPLHYFEQESISDIMQDAEGNMWLTTLKSGIYFILNKNVRSIGSTRQPFNYTYKIDSRYLACSKNGEIYLVNNRDVVLDIIEPLGTNYKRVYDIYNYDSNTLILIGIGSFLLDKHSFKTKGGYLSRCYYKGIRWKDGNKYFYLFGHGLIVRNDIYSGKKIDSIRYNGSRIQDIQIADHKNIWMGTLTGLVLYDIPARSFSDIGTGLLRSRINALNYVPGKVVIATDGAGVLVYDIAKGTYTQVSEKDGLSSNSCQSIYLDGRDIWVATNRGISVLHTGRSFDDILSIRKIDKHDGLPGEEINKILIDGDRVLVASNSGLTWLDKNMITENRLPPRIYFKYTRTNKSTYTNPESELRLASDENYLEFNFYGISYKSLKDLNYKYRLNGTGENWNYTYEPRITYPALSPGKYSIEIYAVNNDGVSSLHPIVCSFEIRSPFWLTWPFLLAVALFISGIVVLVFYYRLRLIKKREQERNYYNNKMLEYEMRALKAQMNPHFIFNAVASIQNFIITSDLKAANRYLVKFSRLIRGVLDNSHSNMIPLSKELDTLKLYIDIENLRFSNRINYSIVLEGEVDADRFLIPPLLIQPFVENAIWHGLLPRHENCELLVKLGVADGKIVCSIDDNGVGRQAAALRPVQSRKKRSLGVEMTQNRIIALEKIYNMNLNIEIIDKIDTFQQPAGTTVILTLPIITQTT